MRIWEWGLQITDLQTIEIPSGAKLLTAQMQGGRPRLWAMCDASAPLEPRMIAIYLTGQFLDEYPGTYIATFQDGAFVFHVFEATGS